MRKLALLSTAVFIMLGATGSWTPGQAQDLAWCRKFKGMLTCMYDTRAQCRAGERAAWDLRPEPAPLKAAIDGHRYH